MKKAFLLLSILISFFLYVGKDLYAADLHGESQFYNLVIFIKFADEDHYQAPHSFTYYNDMFNGVDMASLRDYYLEVSYNQLTIDSLIVTSEANVITYYQDIYDRSYYEPYDALTNPNGYEESESTDREHALLARAVDYVDDFNLVPDHIDLDVNLDGDIDSITFMVSGEDTDWASLLWPHMWSLYGYNAMINGKYAYNYTFELLGNNQSYDYAVDVGVLAHETFHLIGAPDLYHYYRYDTVHPVGEWGLMEYNGRIPSHMLGYMKYEYGKWISTVQEIRFTGTYTLYPLQDGENNIYKIDTGKSNEWIYLEYRNDEGLYESNLPGFGLIVYRVDLDFLGDGNVDGYYDPSGNPRNEVYVYRPDIFDKIEPYTFEDNGDDVDGDPNQAALSQYNLYDEIGYGTAIPLFGSDGYELPIKITNVVEHDGYVTFDVVISPAIEVIQDGPDKVFDELTLFDHELMDYEVAIRNIPLNSIAYYTTDGSEPTTDDPIYDGTPISIDSNHHLVKAAIYHDGIYVETIEQNFIFEQTIESAHDPYGNELEKTWYLDFGMDTDIKMIFDSRSKLEEDYDYLYLNNDVLNARLTGTQFSNVIEVRDSYLFVKFTTDEFVDEYYGFLINFTFNQVSDVGISLNGPQTIEHNIGDPYNDLGAELINSSLGDYLVVTDNININEMGTYLVTYEAYDMSDHLLKRIFRTVIVGDFEQPIVELIGDEVIYIEYGETYTELGVEVSDNYDLNPILTVDNNILIHTLGTYQVIYQAYDASFNFSEEVIRTVIVRDTTSPVIELKGLETVYVEYLATYRELGITYTDNHADTGEIEITGSVDTSILGTYQITYQASDISGNESNLLTRNVIVRDNTKPLIILNGESEIMVEYLSAYLELGASFTDNYDTEGTVTISGDLVNTSVVGTYLVIYQFTDSNGNIADEVTRTVYVTDTTPPQATLNESIDTLEVGNEFVDASVTFEEGSTLSTTGTVDHLTVGSYLVTYTVTDINGNDTVLLRYVHVIAKTSHEISFELDETLSTIYVDETYVDGDCEATIDGIIYTCDSTNTIDSSVEGIYQVTYSYEVDEVTYTYQRYVHVVIPEPIKPITLLYVRKEEEVTSYENH